MFGGYRTRAIAVLVRRAAMMAGHLAGGDLSIRMPETGAGEVDALERAFNTMAGSLADMTRLLRHDDDGTAVGVAGSADPGVDIVERERFTLEADNVTARVLRKGRPARMDGYEGAAGSIARELRRHGVRASVGAPIVVGGRLWGVMIAGWRRDNVLSTDSRGAWHSSPSSSPPPSPRHRAGTSWRPRGRASWHGRQTRRRLERRPPRRRPAELVHTVITLKLARRALGDACGPAVELVGDALEHAERANEELRELAHGILPATQQRARRRDRDAGVARAAAGGRGRDRRARGAGARGDGVLRRAGGADQHGQARPRAGLG